MAISALQAKEVLVKFQALPSNGNASTEEEASPVDCLSG
jgi:hypothetical protein